MTPMEQEGYLPEYERDAFEAAEQAYEESIEKRINTIFHGDEPRCECCGERNKRCRYRPAYQMMLCPRCPPKGMPRQ
jgi:hypothetical protein